MPTIHPTAIVDSAARIADDAWIGPYCMVGAGVTLGPGCRLDLHVNVEGRTEIGARTRVAPFASLGSPPQSKKYRGGETRLLVGADCDIRESVTMSRGTEDGGGITVVGDRCLFMANAHVGHDCRVGDDVTMANNAVLGGHCVIGSHVFMGGLSAAHQFTRIGANAMVSGLCGVRGDVIPYGFAAGSLSYLAGLNIVGMKRRNVPRQSIHAARRAYRTLFNGDAPFSERVDRAEADSAGDPVVAEIIAFIRSEKDRALCHPKSGRGASSAA